MSTPNQKQVEIIGDFEIYKDKILGKGAWGEVYRGRQVSLEREVAVKILKKEFSKDEDFVRRFIREAKCIAQLVDENIIQIYGAGKHEEAYYFVMEFVHGITLQKFIDYGRKFSADEVVYIGLCVAKALRAAWGSSARIIHRDIKPSNIMVSFSSSIISAYRNINADDSAAFMNANIKESRIKVMDFGLAKAAMSTDQDATLVGTIIGTPKYISPEQGLGNPADIRSDIYSLGIVLYELTTGTIPFISDNAVSLVRHHIYDAATPPRQLNRNISVELDHLIMKCIRKDPSHRYTNPVKLISDLEAIRQASTKVYVAQTMASMGTTIKEPPKFSTYEKIQLQQIVDDANNLYKQYQYYEAIEKAQECYKKFPDYQDAKKVIAKSKETIYRILKLNKDAQNHFAGGEFRDACEIYKKVLELEPNNKEAREGLKSSEQKLKVINRKRKSYSLSSAIAILLLCFIALGFYAGHSYVTNRKSLDRSMKLLVEGEYDKIIKELEATGELGIDPAKKQTILNFCRSIIAGNQAVKDNNWKAGYEEYQKAKILNFRPEEIDTKILHLQKIVLGKAAIAIQERRWSDIRPLYDTARQIGVNADEINAKYKELKQVLSNAAQECLKNKEWQENYNIYIELGNCGADDSEKESLLEQVESEINSIVEKYRGKNEFNQAIEFLDTPRIIFKPVQSLSSHLAQISKALQDDAINNGRYDKKIKTDKLKEDEDEKDRLINSQNNFNNSVQNAVLSFKKGEYQNAFLAITQALAISPNDTTALELKTNYLLAKDGNMVFDKKDGESGISRYKYKPDIFEMFFVRIPRNPEAANSPYNYNSVKDITDNFIFMSQYEVTQKIWQTVRRSNPSINRESLINEKKQEENYPVDNVSWLDCQTFCKPAGLRLPTEKEWEYAYRAGTQTRFYWGEKLDGEYFWFSNNSGHCIKF